MTVSAPKPALTRVVRGACPHDCPDTCALDVTVADGRVVKVAGAADHPPTAGVLCTKVASYPERIYHPDRLLHPLRRVGPKGPGARFERISWDAALACIAERFRQIAAADGAEPSFPTATPATRACWATGRWTAASSTVSAPPSSTGRSAPAPAPWATGRRSAAASVSTPTTSSMRG
jgi:anaerobic selenocysteine-containing dehydrogenase